MANTPVTIPNRLAEERTAAGIATSAELARRAGIDAEWYAAIESGAVLPTRDELLAIGAMLGDISPSRLYLTNYRQVIGVEPAAREFVAADYFRNYVETGRLLVGRDELTWTERPVSPDRDVEVFVNLSCSTQQTPHLLLDTVAVFDALGVDFAAAAGSTACCGKPFRTSGSPEKGERFGDTTLDRALGWGAKTRVNWCTACQMTSTTTAARRRHQDGVEHPVDEVQILDFLVGRVREMGDKVPWDREVRRRVLVEGHERFSPIHRDAQLAGAQLLALIPGVDVVGLIEGSTEGSPCVALAREPEERVGGGVAFPATADGVAAHRQWLAELAAARTADTVSCQHQACHRLWSRYVSDGLDVRHAVSILAEGLGCAHPDRYQEAVRLGDPERFVDRTRAIWQSWSITEERARELASDLSDPTYRLGDTGCECGAAGGCSATT